MVVFTLVYKSTYTFALQLLRLILHVYLNIRVRLLLLPHTMRLLIMSPILVCVYLNFSVDLYCDCYAYFYKQRLLILIRRSSTYNCFFVCCVHPHLGVRVHTRVLALCTCDVAVHVYFEFVLYSCLLLLLTCYNDWPCLPILVL